MTKEEFYKHTDEMCGYINDVENTFNKFWDFVNKDIISMLKCVGEWKWIDCDIQTNSFQIYSICLDNHNYVNVRYSLLDEGCLRNRFGMLSDFGSDLYLISKIHSFVADYIEENSLYDKFSE